MAVFLIQFSSHASNSTSQQLVKENYPDSWHASIPFYSSYAFSACIICMLTLTYNSYSSKCCMVDVPVAPECQIFQHLLGQAAATTRPSPQTAHPRRLPREASRQWAGYGSQTGYGSFLCGNQWVTQERFGPDLLQRYTIVAWCIDNEFFWGMDQGYGSYHVP